MAAVKAIPAFLEGLLRPAAQEAATTSAQGAKAKRGFGLEESQNATRTHPASSGAHSACGVPLLAV
jgi:hypothetical protein